MSEAPISVRVSPEGSLEILSHSEITRLQDRSDDLHQMFRQCALAVLNCGALTDDTKTLLETHRDFAIQLIRQPRGIRLELHNAPASAFVDGEMIRGIREHLFAVLRDIVYTQSIINQVGAFDLSQPAGTTNLVFHILRNAGLMKPGLRPNIVVCWGGHSITREEYDYTKTVGHELGLRGLDICTGCGPGAMKGPMKGAAIAHAKQRIETGRYIGISEPGIIAAESPNPIVNELAIMPDIEKRLEAFVRSGHGIIVFPGGVGTAEEILYLLGVLLHPKNQELPFPVIFTGSAKNASYFQMIDDFVRLTLGEQARSRYRIIIDDPAEVARTMRAGIEAVHRYRQAMQDAFYFNWLLEVEPVFQEPFEPTHESMSALGLHLDQPTHLLAADMRRAFSGIVAGNVKDQGIRRVEKHGPFELHGDKVIRDQLEILLKRFVAENRMKLPGTTYKPSYRFV